MYRYFALSASLDDVDKNNIIRTDSKPGYLPVEPRGIVPPLTGVECDNILCRQCPYRPNHNITKYRKMNDRTIEAPQRFAPVREVKLRAEIATV